MKRQYIYITNAEFIVAFPPVNLIAHTTPVNMIKDLRNQSKVLFTHLYFLFAINR